jgi:hypothetical protein
MTPRRAPIRPGDGKRQGLRRAGLVALASGVAIGAPLGLAPAAAAASVMLWSCHGPSGQPLGIGSLVARTSGDGVASTYGSGCSGQIGAPGDGGLAATFTRPDPAGASMASWFAELPANVALGSVTLTRATAGLGGAPIAGDPLVYAASTSTGPLESASLADSSDLALSGTVVFNPATGADLELGVSCALGASVRCAAPPAGTVGVDVASIGFGVTDDDAPHGAVGDVQSPVNGPEELRLLASDEGLGLESATATLAGEPPVTISLGGPSCGPLAGGAGPVNLPLDAGCPGTVSDVPLVLSTSGVPDGVHQLTVTVTDAAGNATTLVSQAITVANSPVVPSATASIGVGSGTAAGGGSTGSGSGSGSGTSAGTSGGPSGGSAGGSPGTPAASCVSPELSVSLHTHPVRISRHDVAVIRRAKPYTFTGMLTCLRGTHRVAGTLDTPIEIHEVVRKHVVVKTGVALRRDGKLTVLLPFPSSRTVEFIYLGSRPTVVKIPLLVTTAAAKR